MAKQNRRNRRIKLPVRIHIAHHEKCREAAWFATKLYEWFRLGYSIGDAGGAGLPVSFRRKVIGNQPEVFGRTTEPTEWQIDPEIDWQEAEVVIVILLVDHEMVVDARWRAALVTLTADVEKARGNGARSRSRRELLPVVLHDSFYRTGRLHEQFNCVRLPSGDRETQLAALRRAATEMTARTMRPPQSRQRPLNVFLSHAKQGGREIAETLRDGIQNFGQMRPWYDQNDLAFGKQYEKEIKTSAADTAGMIAVISDLYSVRPWCRLEARRARRPRRISNTTVWRVQPTLAVSAAGNLWSRSVPMLEGVPRIGWNPNDLAASTEMIVDRLVLEMMLAHNNRQLALQLRRLDKEKEEQIAYITWVPDTWSLLALRDEINEDWTKGRTSGEVSPSTPAPSSKIKKIVYPGYGLTKSELRDLQPAIEAFGPQTWLVSFDDHRRALDYDPDFSLAWDHRQRRLLVALSTEDAPELADQGCGAEHCHELLIRLSTRLMNSHQRVALSLAEGELGFIPGSVSDTTPALQSSPLLERLVQVTKSWYSDLKEAEADGGLPKDSLPRHDVNNEATWPAAHYFPWPFYEGLIAEERAKFVGLCQLHRVKPSDLSDLEMVRFSPRLDNPESLLRHADALRDLRKEMASHCDLRIVWGGAISGDRGWWPRVLEEVYWTLEYGQAASRNPPPDLPHDKPDPRHPLLILGGFGGCAHLIAKFLQDPEEPWPTGLKRLDVLGRDALLTELARESQQKLMDNCRQLFDEFRNELWNIKPVKKSRDGTRRRAKQRPGRPPEYIRGISRDLFMKALVATSLRETISLVMTAVDELREASCKEGATRPRK
ncbi:MAG TPA: hypothetical protein DDY91_05380 [Planctomycetaceae bacterium]|nr:hypothetical protein [Planctomycetaceae bacterium]